METHPMLFFPSSSITSPFSHQATVSQHATKPEQGNNLSENSLGCESGSCGLCLDGKNAVPSLGSENEVKSKKKKGEKKARSPRFAFQTRSDIDILDDGFRWRKYGEKSVKNNKYPRSYYRCTHRGCNVKKQVQRLTTDGGVVVTTYEGMHTHPIVKTTDNFEHILGQMHVYSTL